MKLLLKLWDWLLMRCPRCRVAARLSFAGKATEGDIGELICPNCGGRV